jgi:hypothetical protein
MKAFGITTCSDTSIIIEGDGAMKRATRSRTAKRKPAAAAERRLVEPLAQIWLAGLGAVSKAHAEGPKWLHGLIDAGVRVQAQKRTAAENALRSTLGNAQSLVRRVVHELPPVRILEEIRALRQQVDAMSAKLDCLAPIRRGPLKRRVRQGPAPGRKIP